MSNDILKHLYLLFVILLGLLLCHKGLAARPSRKNELIFYLTVPSPETFSFQCQDQMVKVDSNIYHLDRFRLSLKSNYFEKLLTSGDFELKNDKILEIQPKHGEIFPCVIDVIHGKKLIDVLSKDNYIKLLEAMDQLELQIDLTVVCTFIDDNLKSYSPQDMKILELYNFIGKNSKFEYLLTSVFKYFWDNLRTVYTRELLASMSLNHLIRMITSIEKVDDEKRRDIIQTCTEWLYHDIENRLPRLVILINSIKSKFHSSKESYENNSTLAKCSLRPTNVDEQAYKKSISSCLFALLSYGGKFNPNILRRDDLSASHFGLPPNETHENEVCEKRAEYDEYKVNEPSKFVNDNNEFKKLRKFFENDTLYDITVQVEDKSYKLHRVVLESRCGHFADIFRAEYAEAVAKCVGMPKCPCKDEKYLLSGIDKSTFDAVIDHIYFDSDIREKFNDILRTFKAADSLKIDSLFKNLKEWFEGFHKEINPQHIVGVINSARGKMQYEDLYLIYLTKHISDKWPEIDNKSHLCSISHPMLENMLMSPLFRLDDPHKILDVCSTWIIHDATNRYRFLPRIAKAINPNCVVDKDEYKTEDLGELNNCSQQFVRDKLWQILSKTSYIIPSELRLPKNEMTKLEEVPVFIMSQDEKTAQVLNADLDVITSFSMLASETSYDPLDLHISSASMLDDNLFILLYSYKPAVGVLQVYNYSLKKSFLLSFHWGEPLYYQDYTLLSCNNEIYCCSKSGLVMKFSIQLSRWVMISKDESKKQNRLFTSDGEKLYRMYDNAFHVRKKSKSDSASYIIESYNFEENEWSSVPDIPLVKEVSSLPLQLAVVNDTFPIALFTFWQLILFDRESKTWSHFKTSKDIAFYDAKRLFANCKDKMLLLVNNKLYNFSPSIGNWELKKVLPSEYNSYRMKVIHRPAVRAN